MFAAEPGRSNIKTQIWSSRMERWIEQGNEAGAGGRIDVFRVPPLFEMVGRVEAAT
jgi:hypothetical protein